MAADRAIRIVKSAGQEFAMKAVKDAWSVRWEHCKFLITCVSFNQFSKRFVSTYVSHQNKK